MAARAAMAAAMAAVMAAALVAAAMAEAGAACAGAGAGAGARAAGGARAWQRVRLPDGSERRVAVGESPLAAAREALALCADLGADGEGCDALLAAVWEKALRANLDGVEGVAPDLVDETLGELALLRAELHHSRDRLSRALRAKAALRHQLAHARAPSDARARILPVPVRNAEDLTVADFARDFVAPGVPVIIRGLQGLFRDFASPETVRARCGLENLRLKRAANDSATWAGLERVANVDVDVDAFFGGLEGSDLYLHDEPLRKVCPELLESFRVPAFFAGDIMQRVSSDASPFWAGFRDYWPSVFVSGSNTGSGLHADWCASSAWMAVTHGHKHWRIVPHAMRDLLAEDEANPGTFHESLFPGEGASLPAVDIFDAIVGPGDVIFIPSGAPHQVVNRGVTVAVAMNMVLRENLSVFSSALADQAAASSHSNHAQIFPVLAALQGPALEPSALDAIVYGDTKGTSSVPFDLFKHPWGSP